LRAVLALDCSKPVLYHIFEELHGVHDVFILESRKKQLWPLVMVGWLVGWLVGWHHSVCLKAEAVFF